VIVSRVLGYASMQCSSRLLVHYFYRLQHVKKNR